MLAMRRHWLVPLALVSWGCAEPIALHIRAEPPVPAVVRVRLTLGKEAAVPAECQAPCSIAIPPETKQQLNMQAPGYYPATMEVSYEEVKLLEKGGSGDDGVKLVVPLQPRPTRPDAHH